MSGNAQSNFCVFSTEPRQGWPIQVIRIKYIRTGIFTMVKICIVTSSTMTLCSPVGGINVTKEHGGCIFNVEVTHVSLIKIPEFVGKYLISL